MFTRLHNKIFGKENWRIHMHKQLKTITRINVKWCLEQHKYKKAFTFVKSYYLFGLKKLFRLQNPFVFANGMNYRYHSINACMN